MIQEDLIAVGDAAPDFTLPQADGDPVKLSALRPARVVLFFYPKDATPGCTDEAVGFSARTAEFAAEGVRILGLSKDSVKKHRSFIAKNAITVPLVSDEAGDTCERYGVWQEKQMMGRTYMGIVRTTVLIGSDGTVERVWSPVSVKGHVDEVLAAVRG
jgi:peroxiredoxin Q/BCP